jgi:AbrB family looped-hinge helix DNA binding protein
MVRFSSPISSKGQITIPIDIRTRKGIKPADRFEIVEKDDGIFLRPVRLKFTDLAGIVPALKGREDVDLETIIREAREEHADEAARRFKGE